MKIYNTATRKKEEIIPIRKGEIGLYACGPTVYSSPHIGNMYAYVCWDILVSVLRYLSYKVTYVMNITDVGHLTSDGDTGEDKMEKGSRKEGLSVWEIAKKYENEFFESEKSLNIGKPDVVCRATEHIKEQIDLIKVLEKNGFTYIIDDGVYYDISRFAGYGDFAKLDLEKIKIGARVEVNAAKKNPSDFALWKFSPKTGPKRQMEWDSPWGKGFPGWHIECTAMSTKYLGEEFDIHTGGEDHIPVHHTNEIAQGYGAFGHQTAKVWMHNAFITFNGSKISKSTGGLLTIKDLEALGFDPLAYRYLVLTSHYRKGMAFSLESLESAKSGLNNLKEIFYRLGDVDKGIVDEAAKRNFVEAISDDLAMPEAMAIVWRVAKSKIEAKNIKATLLDFDQILRLGLGDKRELEVPKEVKKLAEERLTARSRKDWPESDRIRELILKEGYVVEDTLDGYKISKRQ